jgi:sacsin
MFREHILCSIPMRLQPDHMPAYFLLIQAMSALYSQEKQYSLSPEDEIKLLGRERVTEYWNWKLAADADGVMHLPRGLYDHDDKVYKAAYGLEAVGRFLHPSVRCYREFWVAMGIQGGNWKEISGPEYRSCLQSLDNRIKQLGPSDGRPFELMSDIQDTLHGLTRVVLHDKLGGVRNEITSIPVIPTRTLLVEPIFRRPTMKRLCEAKPYIPLSEALHWDHIPVCWTQVPFPRYQLSYTDLEKVSMKGRPPVEVVWEHLEALVGISAGLQDHEVKLFLDDLSHTYRFLQMEPTTHLAPDLAGKKLWLNIDIDEGNPPRAREINSSWIDISHMVLFCPYDPGELKYVRSYLTPFDVLLKRCGCQPIRNPNWKRAERKQTSGPTMIEVSRLWKDQRLTDIVFSAEGEQISAHKLILAAASKYCEAQFTGPWSQNSSPETAIELEDMAYSTLTLMITFAYTDELDWKTLGVAAEDTPASSIADKLDVLLDLLAGADRWGMSHLHSTVEAYILDHARTFVRIDNVTHIEGIAKEVQAKDLEGFCKEYREVNKDILTVVEGDASEDHYGETDEMVGLCPWLEIAATWYSHGYWYVLAA